MRKVLDEINRSLLIALSILMVLSALLQVFARTIDLNAQFTEELTIFSMMWVTLFGSAYAFGIKKHIAIDILSSSLGAENQKRLAVFIEVVIILFTVLILLIGGGRFVWITFKLGQVSAVMHIPKGWIYLALPVSGLIILFYSILNIIDEVKKA
ncbi:MAG: TRAP transporter small permease subunit [Bacteroidota bacterium]